MYRVMNLHLAMLLLKTWMWGGTIISLGYKYSSAAPGMFVSLA